MKKTNNLSTIVRNQLYAIPTQTYKVICQVVEIYHNSAVTIVLYEPAADLEDTVDWHRTEARAFAALTCLVNAIESGKWPLVAENWVNYNSKRNDLIAEVEPLLGGLSFVTPRVVETLCSACIGEVPWNSHYDPAYFDKLLVLDKVRPYKSFFQ